MRSRHFFGLFIAVIMFDVAPAPGENYSRCGSEQTPLEELEIIASGNQLHVGELMQLEARGTWGNGDIETVWDARWSVEPEGIVQLETQGYFSEDGNAEIMGLAEGVATITVVSDEIGTSLEVTVLPAE